MQTKVQNNKLLCTDVLAIEHFQHIFKIMTSDTFPWFYHDHVVEKHNMTAEEKHQIQFVHKFHEVSHIMTHNQNWELLFPIFEVLRPHTFIRVKANNIPGHEKIITHGMHSDTGVPLSYTAIYYVNSNNGYTEFEDGDKIPSVANSMIVFPSYMRHTGSTCTDARSRINININFVANWDNEFIQSIVPESAKTLLDTWKQK